MPHIEPLLSAEDIGKVVQGLARDIRQNYCDRNPLLIGVLKGCFVFMADLVRHLDVPVEVEFLSLSSYGMRSTKTSGAIRVLKGLHTPLRGRHVLVVEDIVDTGLTLRFTLDYLQRKGPASLAVCALFDKPARRQIDVPIDYRGFVIPDLFVVGYGLDYDEHYRQLPGLCSLQEDN